MQLVHHFTWFVEFEYLLCLRSWRRASRFYCTRSRSATRTTPTDDCSAPGCIKATMSSTRRKSTLLEDCQVVDRWRTLNQMMEDSGCNINYTDLQSVCSNKNVAIPLLTIPFWRYSWYNYFVINVAWIEAYLEGLGSILFHAVNKMIEQKMWDLADYLTLCEVQSGWDGWDRLGQREGRKESSAFLQQPSLNQGGETFSNLKVIEFLPLWPKPWTKKEVQPPTDVGQESRTDNCQLVRYCNTF